MQSRVCQAVTSQNRGPTKSNKSRIISALLCQNAASCDDGIGGGSKVKVKYPANNLSSNLTTTVDKLTIYIIPKGEVHRQL